MLSKQIMGFSITAAAVSVGLLVGTDRPISAQEKQTAPQKTWKDKREYEEAKAAYDEKDKTKRLALLDKWKQDYPTTDYSDERQKMYSDASSAAGATPKQETPATK